MSIRNLRYWEPMLDIRVARGFPAHIIPDLRHRLIEFELEDHANLADKASMSLDNGDGRLLMPEHLAFGIIFNISFGYVGALSPPRLYQVRKMSGAMRVGGVGAQSGTHTAAGGIVNFDMRSKLWSLNIFRGASGAGREDRQLRFERASVTDVVRILARRNGYDTPMQFIEDLADGEPVHEDIVIPSNMSDAEWIRNEARDRGWSFDVDSDGLRFHSARYDHPDGAEELVWFAGDPDIIKWGFDGDMNVPPGVNIFGSNPREESTYATFAATSGTTNQGGNGSEDSEGEVGSAALSQEYLSSVNFVRQRSVRAVSSEQIFSVPDVSSRSRARAERASSKALDRWTMKLELVGNPNVHGRRKLRLRNFGPLIDGLWSIKMAKHTYKAGGVYRTTVEAKRHNPDARGGQEHVVWAGFESSGNYRSGVSLVLPRVNQPTRLRQAMSQ